MKIPSKIIISVLLALVFWGGVNFDFGNNGKNLSLGAGKVYAEDCTPLVTSSNADPNNTEKRQLAETCVKNQNEQIAAETQALKKDTGSIWAKTIGKVVAVTGDYISGILKLKEFATVTAFLAMIGMIVNALTAIIALTFDSILSLSLINFKNIIEAIGITEAWEIFRNLINITFIFVLLYISISMILGSLGPKKKATIAGVVISALFINFSLFMTRIIIDFGNILSAAIYSKTTSGAGWTTLAMQGLQLQTIFDLKNFSATGQVNTVILLTIQIILSAILLWALLYGIIFILGRLIMLIILLATSPIGFAGFGVPWLKDKADDWWKNLANQVFLLPIFMFFLMITSNMLKAADKIVGLQNANQLLDLTKFQPGTWVYFGLIIAMLLACVKMTKKMSGAVADIAGKVVQAAVVAGVTAVTAGGGALAARGAAMAARGASVAARGAVNQLAGGGAASARAARTGLASLRTGRILQTAGNAISGQTFKDLAAQPNLLGTTLTGVRKTLFDKTKKETGVDLDKAFKYIEDRDKEYEKRYGEIANKIGGKKERDELDTLKKISTNIENQAKSRHQTLHKGAWDNQKNMPATNETERRAKKAELDRLNNEARSMMSAVAQEMGVNLTEHTRRQDELKVIIEQKTIDKNRYAAMIPNKKMADKIRSEVTYQAKDKPEETMEKLLKQLGFEKAKKEEKSSEEKPPIV